MELGNIAFGHSQPHRVYEIERSVKFEGLLACLFEMIAPFGDTCYGVYYENETFFTQPYQWDVGCTCGLQEEIDEWYDAHPHPSGCAVHYTYYRDKEFDRLFGNREHDFYCLARIPNFLYKPTKLEIEWYKYPLRDSYSNQEITLLQFKEIIDDCIRSVKEEYKKKNFYNLALPFGKYKGEKIIEVGKKDINYLWWLFQKTDVREPYKECLESFFGKRLRGLIFNKIRWNKK